MSLDVYKGIRSAVQAALNGTVGSAIAGVFLLPLTSACIRRQQEWSRTRQDFIRDLMDPKVLSKLYRLSGKAVVHSVTRSFASLGVGNSVLQGMSEEASPTKKGLIAGLCAGVSQALLTTWFSHVVIAGISNQPQLSLRSMVSQGPVLRRVYSIALIKNALDLGLAFPCSQIVKAYLLEKEFPDSAMGCSFLSGIIGASAASLCCMPLVSAETNVLSKPCRPFRQWLSQVASKKDVRVLFRGCGIRLVRSSLALGIGLAVTDRMNDFSLRHIDA